MRRWLSRLVLALAALSGGACRDHSGDATPYVPDGGAQTLALTALDQELIESHCDYLLRCGFYADRTLCERALTFNLAEALGPHIAAGAVHYDPAAAYACVAGIRSGSCYFYDPAPPSPTICRQVFQGATANDAPCAIDSQCLSGRCAPSVDCPPDACCPGTCLALPAPKIVAEGQPCTSESENLGCGDGMTCWLTLQDEHPFTCVRRLGLGEICDELPCQRELFCLPSTTGPATCVHYPRRGEACSDALGVCAFRDDYCDKTTYTCVPLGAVSTACQSDSTCARSNFCDMSATHTCKPRKGPGEACEGTRQCLGFLDCIGGTCTKVPPRPVCPAN